MSTQIELAPEYFKESARKLSLTAPSRKYYVDRGFQSNIFWVTPIEDRQRNIMCYENGVCIWNKEVDALAD